MKVLFVASECAPFAKTGGLGDVIGSLPAALRQQGADVRVMLPKYASIAPHWREQMRLCATCEVRLGWRRQYCGVEQLEHNGITYYFIDNEYYFRRPDLYGYYDEAERYAFFNYAVLTAMRYLDFQADVLHCHDWQSGMIPLLLDAHYRHDPFYQSIRTVFTIHNLKYQGIFPHSILGDLLNLGDEYFHIDGVEFYGQVSFMKAALNFADFLTTVSPSYAEEIQHPYYGEQLDGLLRKRSGQLRGIVNGIDYSQYNPAEDPHLFVRYEVSDTDKKRENKWHLQQMLGLPQRGEVPMVGMVTRLVEQKGIDLIVHVLEEILQMDLQLVLLGTGEARYEDAFRSAAWRHPDKIAACITFDDGLARKVYAASDLYLMPSKFEPCGISQLIALRYGAAPIVRETGGLKDTVLSYNEFTRQGNGFSFHNYNAHDMLYTIGRAVRFYHDREHWPQICRNIEASRYTWEDSARKYMEIYQMLRAGC
jgi:starch synthase